MGILSTLFRSIDELTALGYPREVAERIVSGELPMDQASRMARAEAQGFNPNQVSYHGTDADFSEFIGSPYGSLGPGVYLTPDSSLASEYANSFARSDITSGAQVMPLLVRGESIPFKEIERQNPTAALSDLDEVQANYRRSGITSAVDRVNQVVGRDPQEVQAVFDPRDIRSYLSAAFDPEYKGANILGSAAGTAAALGLLAAPEDAEAGFITRGGKTLLEAWHGSPHKFDKFSMDAIGTGEGAQAYGHGLYFADSEDVARGYRDGLTANPTVDMANSGDPAEWAAHLVRMHGGEEKAKLVLAGHDGSKLAIRPQRQEAFDAIESGNYKNYELPEGALYRTEIDVTPESLLDWDKPLSEQSEAVQEVLGPYRSDFSPATGGALNLATDALGKGVPEQMLSERGIKGIKYLDGASRHPTQAEADIANEIRELEKRRELALFMSGTPDVPDLSDSIRSLDGDIASRRQALKEMEDARQTSNYVIFDDSLINIAERGSADPRLLAGIAAGGGLLATQSEDAEAGIAKSAIQSAMANVRTPQEFLSALERLGASPEQAAQIARGEVSPSTIGVASTNADLLPVIDRTGGLIDARFDPRIDSRIRNASLETGILSRGTMDDIPRVALSDLEGQRFVTSMSDRTAAGGLLESINGVNLNNLINLQGGQGFMFENPGMVWASAPTPVNQILKAAGGDNVFYLPWRMAPTGGDFATKTGETMISYASANMTPTNKKALDKAIREYVTVGTLKKNKKTGESVRTGDGLSIKGWKGVDDPESIEVWRNTPDSVRKEIMDKVFDKQFRKKGGLSLGEARLAVTDPSQRFAPDGGIQNVGQIFGDRPAIIGSGHPSYPAGVPGQGVGQLDQLDMSIFDLIPDARIGTNQVLVSEAVDPTNPSSEALRALQMKPYSGVVTEDILKTLDDRGVNVNSMVPMFSPSQDRALAYAGRDQIDPRTIDEQRIATHQSDVNKQMAQLGLLADPMYEYGSILPAKTNIVTGESSLAFPDIVRDIVGGLLDLANTRRSGVYNPSSLMDVAL